ncbi:MAG: GNAT family N-acetyltransferase [Endomicrobium sp.]|jgi:ribosomal protein S18 acetylase RimI-like enzyme|nr:GNAT family N-acetyltransferase [Endomicrobium sp.]
MEIIPVETQELIDITEKIAYEIWREHYASIITDEQIEYMLENFQSAEVIAKQISMQNYKYFLMKSQEGSFEGYFAIAADKEHIFLSKIYVRKSRRGKGYGKKAVFFIKDFAEENNFKSIFLTVNKNNINSIETYKKIGFYIEEEIKQDIGNGFFMDDYKMRLVV